VGRGVTEARGRKKNALPAQKELTNFIRKPKSSEMDKTEVKSAGKGIRKKQKKKGALTADKYPTRVN